ncbi:C2 domain protein [Dictyocaulus viviparus]|uniref:C2 domain protein n=1 Tax=Dictyocaulus viviparus TaxID=29172 RepID=A0A0D8XRH5_DICVI|nr:C2 domain protein [Dictyocaulus viviparus]
MTGVRKECIPKELRCEEEVVDISCTSEIADMTTFQPKTMLLTNQTTLSKQTAKTGGWKFSEKETIYAQKLGKIHISSCIEKDAKRLTINLKKVDDLPRWRFLGAPARDDLQFCWLARSKNVCIRITMAQGDKQQTKSSRVIKSTTTAVYNEAVMFLFNTSKKEIDTTKITITVHDMQSKEWEIFLNDKLLPNHLLGTTWPRSSLERIRPVGRIRYDDPSDYSNFNKSVITNVTNVQSSYRFDSDHRRSNLNRKRRSLAVLRVPERFLTSYIKLVASNDVMRSLNVSCALRSDSNNKHKAMESEMCVEIKNQDENRLKFSEDQKLSCRGLGKQSIITCTGDDAIGCAYLGLLAQDKSEIEQWKATVEHMGKEYKGAHNLKPPHSAPPVHVAETEDADK